MATQVFLSIGSNIDRRTNVSGGLKTLQSQFGDLVISPIYESKSYGFEGDDFYNLVVGFNTELDIDTLEYQLREIEYQFGRKSNEKRFASRTLDLDLLLFGDLICENHELPRVDITEYAFVLKPLCDIAPKLVHPLTGTTIESLWEVFDSSNQEMCKLKNEFVL